MRSRLVLIAAILTATVRGTSAQTGTADGVAALARGDYPRAAQILKPIAEDLRTNDAAAQFFMAGLYESGRGVPADELRACALYQRATGNFDHPFGREALFLFGRLIGRGEAFNRECQQLANIGFDHGFQPATFFLGPAHAIEWTLAAATITHEGRTRREEMSFAQPGARFLPLRHTELTTRVDRSLARHFIEIFLWRPSRADGGWTLQWHLFEVVRDQVIPIDTVESVATVETVTPPSSDAFDVREYTDLRVDEEGHAAWAVLKGPNASSARIESDDERREVRTAEDARSAAMKRVDWNRRSDVHRQPEMAYLDADGCGDFEMYGWTADRAESLVVRVDASALGLSTQPATIDLARDTVNVSVATHVFARPQRQFNVCSDVTIVEESNTSEIWRAVAGTLTIELSAPGIRARAPHQRRVTLILNDVVLQNNVGTRVHVQRPVRLTGIVGSMWG